MADQFWTEEFEGALRNARANPWADQPACNNDPTFTLYETAPSVDEAREMCAPCPLLDLCRASALETKPAWGVWGGIVWVMGRQYHLRRKAEYQFGDGDDDSDSVDARDAAALVATLPDAAVIGPLSRGVAAA